MIFNFIKRSISNQISLILVVLIVFVIGSMGLYDFITTNDKLSKNLTKTIKDTNERLGVSLKTHIWNFNKPDTSSILELEMTNREIFAIIVLNPDKTLFLGKKRDNKWNIENIESFDKLPKYKVNTSNTNNFNIFYGGGINKHRGIQIVIRGIALLNDHFSDFNFDIVGDGKYLEKLIKLSVTLNISSRIKFYGYLPFGEMLAILQNANVAVIPHLKSEHTDTTIPHKIFQYIYAGIPILSSDCNPLRRIIEETHSGIIYKNDSPTDFAENLIELKNLISLGKFNPEYGRTFIVNKYNWDKDAQKLIQLYSEFDQTK